MENNKADIDDLEVTPLRQGEEADFEQESDAINISDLQTFNSKFVQAIILAVQDSTNAQELADITAKCFRHIINLANSIPNANVSYELLSFAKQIKVQIKNSTDNEKEQEALINQILRGLTEAFTIIEGVADGSYLKLKNNAAASLLYMIETLLEKEKVHFSQDLAKILVSLCQFIVDHEDLYLHQTQQVYELLTRKLGYDAAQFKKILLDTQKLIKYNFLARINSTEEDKVITSLLEEKFNEIILNDKHIPNVSSIRHFVPFLKSLTPEQFIAKIHPQIDFMLKRTASLIPAIAETIKHLSFKIDQDLLKQLTTDILNDQSIMSEELSQDCSKLFVEIARKIEDPQVSSNLFVGFLLKKFLDTKATVYSAVQRQNIIKHINAALKVVKPGHIDQEIIQKITLVLIDHIFQVKDEAVLKDAFDAIVSIVLMNDDIAFINEPLKKLLTKSTNIWQVNFFNEIMDKSNYKMQDTINILQTVFKNTLAGENFNSTVNYPYILSLVAFFCFAFKNTTDKSYISWIRENDVIMRYLCTSRGFINKLAYFEKNPSFYDTKYHMTIIQTLILINQEEPHPHSDHQLKETLCEYLLNTTYKFREYPIYKCFEHLCKLEDDQLKFALLKSILAKVKQVSQRPVILSREEYPHRENLNAPNKIKQIVNFILKGIKHEITSSDFMTLLKLICHPFVSTTQHNLNMILQSLKDIFQKSENKTILNYFDVYGKDVVQFALYERSGILSPNSTLRALSSNMLVALGKYGQLNLFINGIEKILDYKPLELAHQMDVIFQHEFDRISYYNLMHYSEVAKDLLTVFKEKDDYFVKKEIFAEGAQQQDSEVEDKEEEKIDIKPKTAAIDPSKLAAEMLKKQAALKKAQQASKGKGTTPTAKPAAKPAQTKPQKKQEEEKPAHHVDKEQRNKADRLQIISYFEDIQKIKGQHIYTALDVIKRVLQSDVPNTYNYLDIVLEHLLIPLTKLLHFAPSKFTVNNSLIHLFEADNRTPFFRIKSQIHSCLVALSQSRIQHKNMGEFQTIFQHLESTADYSDMDKGYLQLVLSLTNFVLKDLSVHLSVKEQALNVTQSILEKNVKVQNIDLVRVTINMMKSSYVSDNLSNYLALLFRKISLEEIALMVQRLFEYEPIPRQKFLMQLLEFDAPLFCPVWFSSQIWILQFDEENSIRTLARKIWNKYGMVVRTGVLDLQKEDEYRNVYYYMRYKNTNIFDATLKSACAAIEIFQNRFDLIIDDLIEFYEKELQIIEYMSLSQSQVSHTDNPQMINSQEGARKLIQEERYNRIAVAEILKRTAHLVQASSFKKIFEFFITKGCLDPSESVAKACMEASIMIVQAKGPDYAEDILRILEKYINEQKKYSELSKNQAIIMIGSLATFLDNTSQKKLVGTFEKMLELLHSPSELIRQSICKCIPQLARFFEDKSKKFFEDHFKILRESTDEKLLRGSAYAVSGIIKGLGMQQLIQYDILAIMQKESFGKHTDPLRKISALYLYETLSFSLGKSFEMNIVKILPSIQGCITDQKEQVRKAALNTNKALMGRFSNHAIKQVLPIFLKGLETDNWRGKLASVEALGNMAYCAPKQISGFLPLIVKGIREVLNDTHEKVHAAALLAIQNIGSVIKCPEIADILDILVKSLSNPNIYLKQALKTLLDTSFVHAIDAPSLSLLIPILDHGLMMHDNETKTLAAKLMGNICNLTQDPTDLLPYMKILMPAIKNSLFDSIPEIRASAAKALGSLSRGLGLDNSHEMLIWLREVLHQRGLASSERSGAAQGFAEIISGHGTKFFEEVTKEIILNSRDEDPQIREAYRAVMVFLPTSFEQFVKYLPSLLPLMIEGVSDDNDEVRKTSLRSVKICIKQFARQAPNQLVTPIQRMMFDPDFKVRTSSSVLMYQLVKELENDIIKSQPKYITNDTKNEILSAMFILKYDTIERVATQAAQIWKNIIDNQLKVLKQIIKVVINQAFGIIQEEAFELQEMGLSCMRGVVEKFGDKIVNESLDIFESYLERATDAAQTIGISKALLNMAEAAPTKLLLDIRHRIISIMDPNLYHENEIVRNLASKVFVTIFQKLMDPSYISATIDNYFLKKLHQLIIQDKKLEAMRILNILKDMIKSAPELRLEDKLIVLCNVPNHDLSSPFTIGQARVLQIVAPSVAHMIYRKKFYNQLLSSLISELTAPQQDDPLRIQAVLVALSELIATAPEVDLMTLNETIAEFYQSCKKLDRMQTYVDLIAYYCRHTKVNYEAFAKEYLRNVLVLINVQNDKLMDSVVECMNAIFEGLPKENQFYLVPLIKDIIEEIAVIDIGYKGLYKKKVQTIKLLEKPNGVKSLVSVVQNSIMHGSIDIRTESAICFKYLIEFSKPEAIKGEIIKICGALIRVVNDKFPPELKIQIFYALKLILIKASVAVRAMVPQLQTTFLKAFNDSQATQDVRKTVIENLLLLIKITPKVDPIVKELASLLEGEKLDQQAKVEVSEALALIIKSNGKTIQPAQMQQIQSTLVSIIEGKGAANNERTITNCAVALAFLAAHLPDTAYIQELFNSYDANQQTHVSIGLKAGVILSGHTAIDQNAKTKQFEEYVLKWLNARPGVADVDGSKTLEDAEDTGRLHGAFDVIGHVGDIFFRRFVQSDSDLYKLQFNVINQSGIMEKLNDLNEPSDQTFKQVLKYLASIPIKLNKDGNFDEEVKQVIKEGLAFIQEFYLDLDSKADAAPALMNLLQLNYDNYLDINDEQKIVNLTKEKARELMNLPQFNDILDNDMKMVATDIIFFWLPQRD